MLADMTLQTFSGHVGSKFRTHVAGHATDLTLIEASAVDHQVRDLEPTQRRQFSLLFRGPLDVAPEQGIYSLEHASLGSLEIFLVPIHPDAEGCLLEAVFT
jgi:hypothetical protein